QRPDVGDVGQVRQLDRFRRQQRRGEAGEGRVLRAGDGDLAVEPGRAFDYELVPGLRVLWTFCAADSSRARQMRGMPSMSGSIRRNRHPARARISERTASDWPKPISKTSRPPGSMYGGSDARSWRTAARPAS